MSDSPLLRRLAVLAASLAIATSCGHALAQARGTDRLVIFGSSLSDTGNAFVFLSDPANTNCGARLSVPPYDQLDDLVVPDGPYAKGGHHFTNGAVWAEGLARYLALAGNARPALRSGGKEASNYAAGGARAVTFPCRFNLPDQVAAYLAAFPQTSPQTLITLEIGGNDVRDALVAAASGQDPAPYVQNALASLANSIATLYAHGARRFLLLDVPNLGRAPAVRMLEQQVPGAAAAATQLSQAFNAGFAGVVQYAKGLGGADARMLRPLWTARGSRGEPGNLWLHEYDRCMRHAECSSFPVHEPRCLRVLGRRSPDAGHARAHRTAGHCRDVGALRSILAT